MKQSARKIEKPVVKIRSVSRKENPCVLTRGGVSTRDSSNLLFYLRSWFEVVLAAVHQRVCWWHCRLWLHSILNNIFMPLFLFLAVLSLCCCTWAFSSCGELGLLSSCGAQASHCSDFFCCGAQALGTMGFSSCSADSIVEDHEKHRLKSIGL